MDRERKSRRRMNSRAEAQRCRKKTSTLSSVFGLSLENLRGKGIIHTVREGNFGAFIARKADGRHGLSHASEADGSVSILLSTQLVCGVKNNHLYAAGNYTSAMGVMYLIPPTLDLRNQRRVHLP